MRQTLQIQKNVKEYDLIQIKENKIEKKNNFAETTVNYVTAIAKIVTVI